MDTVYGWRALIADFYPRAPALIMLDAGLMGGDGRGLGQVKALCEEVPGLPITVVGDTSMLPHSRLLNLGSLGVLELLGLDDLSVDRIRTMAAWTVDRRVLLMLRAARDQPIPAVVAATIDYAMARHMGRLPVVDLAAHVGYSSRWLRRKLARVGAPTPGAMITWGRLLWAVHDLVSDPTRSGDQVAWDLGFTSSTVLGNALHRRLGVRIGMARERGLDWAIEQFVLESGLCERGAHSSSSG